MRPLWKAALKKLLLLLQHNSASSKWQAITKTNSSTCFQNKKTTWLIGIFQSKLFVIVLIFFDNQDRLQGWCTEQRIFLLLCVAQRCNMNAVYNKIIIYAQEECDRFWHNILPESSISTTLAQDGDRQCSSAIANILYTCLLSRIPSLRKNNFRSVISLSFSSCCWSHLPSHLPLGHPAKARLSLSKRSAAWEQLLLPQLLSEKSWSKSMNEPYFADLGLSFRLMLTCYNVQANNQSSHVILLCKL